MKETIFDLIEKDIPEGKKGYFELAKNAPEPTNDSFLSNIGDYGKSILKGYVEGVSRFGRMMGPTSGYEGLSDEQQLERQTENLDKVLPTKDGFVQSSLRRGLKEAPSVLAFPGSTLSQTLPRAIAAGFLGEGAKELGAPEWVQSAAELTAFIGPDLTKKLIESGSNKELIKAARDLGLSDEAIAPLINSEFKQKWLSKLSPRRGSTEKILEKSKSELGKTYNALQKSSPAQKQISEETSIKLIKSLKDKMFEMPSSVREKILTDFKDLQKNPITGDSLINFYADINHATSSNSKQLSLLKEPIKEALKEISPELSKQFETINKLYSKYYKIASRLKPNLMSDLVGASENIGLLTSIITGYYPQFLAFTGKATASKLSQQLLLNPRYQQLSLKMVDALNENKFSVAKKLSDTIAYEVRKTSPELADKLEEITEEEFKELLSNRPRKGELK